MKKRSYFEILNNQEHMGIGNDCLLYAPLFVRDNTFIPAHEN